MMPNEADTGVPSLDTLFRRVAREGLDHIALRATSVLVGLAAAPLLARHLEPSGFGKYTAVLLVFSLVMTVGEGGLSLLLARTWPTLSAVARPGWLRSFVRLRIIAGLVVACTGVFVALVMPLPGELRTALVLAMVVVPFGLLGTSVTAFFTAELRPRLGGMIELGARVSAVVALSAVVVSGGGLLAVVGATFVGHVLGACIAICVLFGRSSPSRHEPARMWHLTRQAAPLALLPLVGVVYARADTLVLAYAAPFSDVGRYGIAYRVLEALQLLAGVGASLVTPMMVSTKPEQRAELYRRASTLLAWLFFPAALILFMMSSDVLRILGGDSYLRAGAHGARPEQALMVLMIAGVLMVVGMVNGAVLIAHHRDREFMSIFAVCICVNLTLAFWLTARISLVGAAVATLATELLALGLTGRVVRREIGPSRLLRVLAWPIAGAMAGAVVIRLTNGFPVAAQATGGVIGALAVLAASQYKRVGRAGPASSSEDR